MERCRHRRWESQLTRQMNPEPTIPVAVDMSEIIDVCSRLDAADVMLCKVMDDVKTVMININMIELMLEPSGDDISNDISIIRTIPDIKNTLVVIMEAQFDTRRIVVDVDWVEDMIDTQLEQGLVAVDTDVPHHITKTQRLQNTRIMIRDTMSYIDKSVVIATSVINRVGITRQMFDATMYEDKKPTQAQMRVPLFCAMWDEYIADQLITHRTHVGDDIA